MSSDLAMTGGQATFELDAGRQRDRQGKPVLRPAQLMVVAPSAEDLDAHRHALTAVDKASRGACLWLKS